MSNLIPVKRPDKNGHMVTRWVKQEQSGTDQGNGIPAPSVKRESLQQKRARLLRSFTFDGEPSKGLVAVVEAQISFMSPELLDESLEQLEKHPESSRVNAAVRQAINRWAQNERKDDDLLQALQFVGIETVWDKYLKPSPLGSGRSYNSVREGVVSSINTMQGNDGFDSVLGTKLEDEDVERAVLAAYAAVAIEMHIVNKAHEVPYKYMSWEIFQKHGQLVSVFEEFPDRLDEMVDYVHEHGDDGTLRQYMRGDHLSLSDGAL